MVERAFQDVVTMVRRETLDEVIDALEARHEQGSKLLENGRQYLEQAYGKEFDRLYRQRCKIWNKLAVISQCIGIIYELKY